MPKAGADIYLTEFDRIFRHFYFRDVATGIAGGSWKPPESQCVFTLSGDKEAIMLLAIQRDGLGFWKKE